ncbi:Tyrosine recombinase XerC [subsurface metagenome]
MKVPKIKFYQRGRDGIWWVRYSWQGKREHYSLGTVDEAEAEKEVKRIKHEMALGIHQPKKKVIFDNLWGRYKKEEWPEKKPSSRQRDETSIKCLLKIFGGKTINEETFRERVREYRTKRLRGEVRAEGISAKRSISKATVNREIALLKRIVNLTVYEWRLLRTNPLQNFPMLKEEKRERTISPEEWRKLLSAAYPELRDFLIIARFTGIRYGIRDHGILGLEWSDIDLHNWAIRVRNSKNGTGRTVYMDETVYKVFKRRKMNTLSECVFPGINGGRRKSFDTAFGGACRRAGIKDLRIHDLRHMFGSDKKSEGADLSSLAKLMGHKDLKTTGRYGEPNEQHLRQIMKSKPRSIEKECPKRFQDDDVE